MELPIDIISYQPEYQPIFRQLNLEWLDQYNLTEDHDLQILEDPQGTIVDRGGFLWLAVAGEEVIGTAGLMKEHEGVFELVKMSVAPEWRGKGISKLLLETCLAKAKDTGAASIILFSNHQLHTALKLYEKYGFKRIDLGKSPFHTADVKMELVF